MQTPHAMHLTLTLVVLFALIKMYGRYREDLGQFARSQARKLEALRRKEDNKEAKKGFKKYQSAWQSTITGPST